jgi:hypothetical protein
MNGKSVSTLALMGVLALACARDDSGFKSGGSSLDPDWTPPPEDTAPPATDDTGVEEDTSTGSETGTSIDTSVEDTASSFVGEGYTAGDVAYNLVAPDQSENTWRLYQQIDGPTVLVFGDAWDDNLLAISTYLPDLVDKYSDYGVTAAVMLFEDANTKTADAGDAADFASAYDLNAVLYDDDSSREASWAPTQPTTYVIDEDMVITWKNTGITAENQLEDEIKDLVF